MRTFAEAKARGVLVRPLGDAVAISPPLVATREQIDAAGQAIGEAIAAVAAEPCRAVDQRCVAALRRKLPRR